MPYDHLHQQGPDSERGGQLDDGRPDLEPLRAIAGREELADATSRLADCHGRPLPAGDPLMSLARAVARSLTEAGFTLHHCVRQHPLCRLARLGPVARVPRRATDDD
jgi:hypothetical protein